MSDAAVYAFGKATLPTASEAELQFTLTVCRHESGFSTGWKLGHGAGSDNWGAVQETDLSRPHFETIDTHADNSKYVGHFKIYASPEEGLKDAARAILKPNVRAALARGDGAAAVQAMHDNGYFEASVASYVAAMKRNYPLLVKGAKLTPAINFDGGAGGAGLGLLVLVALVLTAKGGKLG